MSNQFFDLSGESSTLVELLSRRSQLHPHRCVYTFLLDGETEAVTVTYGELDVRARAIAALLQGSGKIGECVLLLYPPGIEYITAFFGCLYAGMIAVPSYPPPLNRPDPRLQAIVADAQARIILTTSHILSNLERQIALIPALESMQWLTTDHLPPALAKDWHLPPLESETLAFLQYTSGSTATPKGVMVSHRNILYNEEMIRQGFGHTEQSIVLGWLPIYHDMGLIGNVLQPLYVGASCILMSPLHFLQKPIRWLQAISRFGATTSGAPNFAYDLCVRNIAPEQRKLLDLSSWEVAFNGSEPVRHQTIEGFVKAFSPCGFRREAFYPCFGLAEATLFVTGGTNLAPLVFYTVQAAPLEQHRLVTSHQEDNQETRTLVGCGRTWEGQEIVVVDPESLTRCPPHCVGELWVSGPNIARGYWNKAKETKHTFQAYLADTGEGPFLRTGDLGFLKEGELFVTGRIKDLIIIRGRNYYPQDIELTVEQSHAALQPGSGAAFSLEAAGEERLVIVQELMRIHRDANKEEVIQTIREAVAQQHGLEVYSIVLIRPMSIPKTSSGKIQRNTCRTRFLAGTFKITAEWTRDIKNIDTNTPANEKPGQGPVPAVEIIQAWLVSHIARRLGIKPQDIDLLKPFSAQGLSSLQAVSLMGEMEDWLGRRISPTLAWEYPNIKALSLYLAGKSDNAKPISRSRTNQEQETGAIAVIGIGCRFPGAGDPQAFWQLLRDGVDAIGEVPPERWDAEAFYDSNPDEPGKLNTRWGGFLDQADRFPAHFFGISPREASRIDPQQRLLLEVAWEALENAGKAPAHLAGSQTGVFIGISSSDYSYFQLSDSSRVDAYAGIGNAHSIAANRVSYLFNFNGPSLAVDTACSSSLAALHLACQSLSRGECSLALAGGVNFILVPHLTIAFSQMRLMAADGRCKTFDADADGYVRSEGCGLVVLKRLSEAVAEGDNILAVIRGSALNHDGLSNGLTAPSGPAQQAVIRQALTNAGVAPAQISYVEAHGTGTAMGDPIEVEALKAVLMEGRSHQQPCGLGSVKTNIGHLEAAAGIAGLIKVVLSLQHNEIPPHLHLKKLNPYISFAGTPFFIPTELRTWPGGKGHCLAGVSSFGFGGTNVHVVLEKAPLRKAPAASASPQLLILSAKTGSALETMTANLVSYLEENPGLNLADTAYTLQVGRNGFDYRRMVVCRDRADAGNTLSTLDPQRVFSNRVAAENPPLAFMFPGVGDHYVHMAEELYSLEPVFRETIDHCCELLQPLLGIDLREILYPAVSAPGEQAQGLNLRQMLGRETTPQSWAAQQLKQTEIAHPCVFMIEVALVRLLQAWGIVPAALIGYSLGEYAAACAAGVFSLEEALVLVARRAQMIRQLPEGVMLTVPLSPSQVRPFLGEEISLAVVNGPSTCVLAGEPAPMALLEQQLAAENITCRRLETRHAFHSTLMESIKDQFTALLETLQPAKAKIPFLSNVTGNWITDAEATDPTYWVRHLCQTVRFGDGLSRLLSNPEQTLIEVGPGQSLCSFAKQHPAGSKRGPWSILPTLRYSYDRQADLAFLLGTVGKLWLKGARVDWAGFHSKERRCRIPLPTYPFEGQRYWFDLPEGSELFITHRQRTTGKKADTADWFYESRWNPSPLQEKKEKSSEASGPWLVFEDSTGWGVPLVKGLNQLQKSPVVRVRAGEAFTQPANDTFTLRPDMPDDYGMLLEALEKAGKIPAQVVHMWSIRKPGTHAGGIEACKAAQRDGFYSLLSLVKTLEKWQIMHPIRITVLTNDVQPVTDKRVYADPATILGLCRVIPQEHQNLCCRTIDITRESSENRDEETLVSQLLAELMSVSPEVTVAYRAGTRYVRQYIPKRLSSEAVVDQLPVGGTYLITGGWGGIGLILAEYLARNFQARLVLLGRSSFPPRDRWDHWLANHPTQNLTSHRIQKIRLFESLGAEVLLISADVSSEDQMQAAVRQIYQQFGRLDAVIHAAGLTGRDTFQSLQNTDITLCEAHFQPKVYGLYVLDKVLQGRDVKFCFLFSSLSSILGGLGFAAYAAANRFMDAYVYQHNRSGSTRWCSVNWDIWQVETRSAGLPAGMMLTEYQMTPAEGMRAFARAVAAGVPQLIHSTGDLEARIRQWVKLETIKTGKTAFQKNDSRPDITTAYVPAGNELEKQIAVIWQEALGIDRVGIHDNFFDLGGNSLVGMQLVARIQKELGIRISTVTLFEAPTISTLAQNLQPDVLPGEDSQEAILVQRRSKARQGKEIRGIAIIAMNGRFPGAKNIEELWQVLCDGVETISFFTPEELAEAGTDPELFNDPSYVKARPILDQVEEFDAVFFGYTPREAEILDPQHRLFLECAWESLELTGCNPEIYKGLIGVFAGASISTYMLSWMTDSRLFESVGPFRALLSSDKDSLATTVSYKMNLRGPSLAVQTFCSTSLVAVHLACRSLLQGECDLALAGGVSVRVPYKQGHLYKKGGEESADGHCHTFDARARGTMLGDGVGIVVLKRLAEALEDRDPLHAVIKGSAINNDGSLKAGYTAPSVTGQAEAIAMAQEYAGINPETIGYVEAHGTATGLGDPIEIAALTQAFGKHTQRKGYCPIGSSKTNLGHLDRAAGVTGLIKAAMAVRFGVIPPLLHFEAVNPKIDFENSPFYVNTTLLKWESEEGNPRRACVNSLGVGGTNAHVILEEPPPQPPSGPSRPWQLLLLSARSESALDKTTVNLAQHLRRDSTLNLADVAFTLQMGRSAFEHRRMILCQDKEDALQLLEAGDNNRVLTRVQPDINRPIAFMFPGVGDHYLHMAKELYRKELVFHDIVEQCCKILYPYLGIRLEDLLYPAEEPEAPAMNPEGLDLRAMVRREHREASPQMEKLQETAVAHPVVFVIEYALASLLLSWGIRPQALLGYSLGEYVAACLAGVLSLKDALKLVVERARLIQELPAGSMITVSLSREDIEPFLSEEISLAIHNGETSCVLAGPPQAISRLEKQLNQRGVACCSLNTSHAFHSPMMDILQEPLTRLARTVTLNPPRIPYVSNVSGTWITPEQATDPGYWALHMCQPVRFFDGLAELLKTRDQLILEVGPGQSLGAFAAPHPSCTREQKVLILPTMPYSYENQPGLRFLLEKLGRLWLLGVKPHWWGFYQAEQRQRVLLPTYPFERKRFWVEGRQGYLSPQVSGAETTGNPLERIGAVPRREMSDWFYLPTWKQSAPLLPRLSQQETAANTCWLLFANKKGLTTRVAEMLKEHEQHVVVVQPGLSWEKLQEDKYALVPQSRSDYVKLLQQLLHQGLKPNRIVHMWSVTPQEPYPNSDEVLQDILDAGLYSIMALVQALEELGLASCEISIVSSHLQAVTSAESPCPGKATLLGPCHVIPMEYANISCRSIDIDLPGPGSWQEKALLTNLLGEVTNRGHDVVVALRGYQRWVESFASVHLPPLPRTRVPLLRSGGVYMVTGGLGGIGLAISQHLAETLQAKLVLISRSGLPPRQEWDQLLAAGDTENDNVRKIQQVLHLETLGSQVLVIGADVTKENQMKAAVEEAMAQFGTIHGVIHAAGVPGMGLIQLKTPEMAAGVLAPKVMGTIVLDRVLQGIPVDFLVLFSSTASLTGGGPGQFDYSAANAFMDAYARLQRPDNRLTVSINWSEWQWNAWEEGLVGFGKEVQNFLIKNREQFGITFAEGNEAFERILTYHVPRVVVCTQNFHEVVRISKEVKLEMILGGAPKPGQALSNHLRPELMAPYTAPANDFEKQMVETWQELLGIAPIGIHDNFFELGGHSLLGTRLISRLSRDFQVDLPLRLLFEMPTVAQLALAIEELLIAEIEELSEEEVETQVARLAVPQQYQLPNNLVIQHLYQAETQHFYHDIFEDRVYLKHGITLTDGACVFDVGGNIGLFTLFVHHNYRRCQVYTFEPAPLLFNILENNISSLEADTKLFNCGLSDREREELFTFYPLSSGMSSFYGNEKEEREILQLIISNQQKQGLDDDEHLTEYSDEILDIRLKSETFPCQLRTISGIISENHVRCIDLLKVDVQKSELDVLQGIKKDDWPKIKQVVMEVHDVDGRLNVITGLLQEHGYQVIVDQEELYTGTNIYIIYAAGRLPAN